VTEKLSIPTIGIGAGAGCDGQVLVYADMLGMFSDFVPKFVKQYAHVGDAMKEAGKNRTIVSANESRESDEARGIRESIKEMERELAELDRDIAEAKKGEKGEMSRVALANFRAMRKDIVEMIASNRKLYQVVRESDELERRIEEGA
jgi:hypothetical protein